MVDFAPALRQSRRPRWRRSPRSLLAGLATAVVASVVLGVNAYGALGVGQPQHVHVRSGDSLWSIAATHYHSGDLRDRVDAIISLNRLSSSAITPGEDLLLPAS